MERSWWWYVCGGKSMFPGMWLVFCGCCVVWRCDAGLVVIGLCRSGHMPAGWLSVGSEMTWSSAGKCENKMIGDSLCLYFAVFLFFLCVVSRILFGYCVVYFVVSLACQSWGIDVVLKNNPTFCVYSVPVTRSTSLTPCLGLPPWRAQCVQRFAGKARNPADYHWTSSMPS
jgi:hypothetical protein